MARTRGTAKRQRVATVESALTNIDVISQLAAFLEAGDLCQVKATCKSLGSANDGAAFNGLPMAEEAARRMYEDASDEEKAMLPRYDGESWIELYHHLLMLRARLTFDQLVGRYGQYRGGDKAAVQGKKIDVMPGDGYSSAFGGDHVMRAGKHWATFTSSSRFGYNQKVGVIRPLRGWGKRGLEWFSPGSSYFYQDFQRERTDRWEGDVHYCRIELYYGSCCWSDWREERPSNSIKWKGRDSYNKDCATLGMLLDLGNGTLSVYQNGRRFGTLKDVSAM